MKNLPHSIELHDSNVSSITTENAVVTVTFDPAYVHKDGKGWNQVATITINNPKIEGVPSELPVGVADGTLTTFRKTFDGLLLLPLRCEGHVTLKLDFFSGDVTTIEGDSVQVSLLGTPTFVENVT